MTDLRDILDAIGWSNSQVARKLGLNENQVRRWLSGSRIPRPIFDWLQALAGAHRANPPPSRDKIKYGMANTELIHGNCISILQTQSRSIDLIDLIVTSPPYNAGKEYEDKLSIVLYEAFSEEWIEAVSANVSATGAMWINLGYVKLSSTQALPLPYLLYPILVRHGWHILQEIVWTYDGGMPYKRRFAHRSERWMWMVRDINQYTFNLDAVRDISLNKTKDKRNNILGKNPTDVWDFDRVWGGACANTEKTAHPCQFPIEMIDRIIKACSNVDDLVLDPFGGSGTVAQSAQRLDRNVISIEIRDDYHQIGLNRLAT